MFVLKENNIFQYIESLGGLDAYDIYKNLRIEVNKVCESTPYSSIESNFMPMFVFHLVENKCPLNKFNDLLKRLNEENPHEYKYLFSRFFEYRDGLENIKKFKDGFSTYNWSAIGALFLDISENGKNFCLDKKNIPYLESIFSNLTPNNIEHLYYGGFHSLISKVCHDNESFAFMINAFNKYNVFEMREEMRYHSLDYELLRFLGDNSYFDKGVSDQDKNEIINDLKYKLNYFKKNIKNFDHSLESFIFKKSSSKQNISPEVIAINLLCLCDFDFIHVIQDRCKREIAKLDSEPDNEKNRSKNDLITNVLISLDVSLQFKNYKFNKNLLKMIDMDKDIYVNAVPLKIFEILISGNGVNDINVPEGFSAYIKKISDEQNKRESWDRLNLIKLDVLEKFTNYHDLEYKINKAAISSSIKKKI